jgi:hypothetical protein
MGFLTIAQTIAHANLNAAADGWTTVAIPHRLEARRVLINFASESYVC